jgi:hypothetical protein
MPTENNSVRATKTRLENLVELVGLELPSHPENRQVIESR